MSPSSSKNKYKTNAKSTEGSIKGRLYEKLSQALLIKRGLEISENGNSEIKDFAVGREVNVGRDKKLDDVVFRYTDKKNEKKFIFVQVKHKLDYKKINSEILNPQSSEGDSQIGNMRKDFNLRQYFVSYLKVKKELKVTQSEIYGGGEVKFVAIFTNMGFDFEELNLKGFKPKKAQCDIMTIFTLKKSYTHFYQLGNVSECLHKILKKSSDLHRLAREIAKYVVLEKYKDNIMGIDAAPISHYHVALLRQVIEKSEEVIIRSNAENKQYCEAQFRDDFVDSDDEIGSKQELRDQILEAIRELDKSKSDKSNDDLKRILREAKWKVAPKFGSSTTEQISEVKLPFKWKTIKDEDIADFLKCLVFIVDQPGIEDLKGLLYRSTQDTILKDNSLGQVVHKIQNSCPELMKEIEKVTCEKNCDEKENPETNKENGWYFKKDIVNFFDEKKQLISISIFVTAMSLIYEKEIMQYGKFNNYGKIVEAIDGFLRGSCNFLCVNTSASLLTSIEMLQYLNIKKKYIRISVSMDILKHNEYKECIVKAFELESKIVLTIECRGTANKKDVEELCKQLYGIAKGNQSKKLILILQQNELGILAEKLRTEFGNEGLYVLENDSIHLEDFEPKEDPLQKDVFVFQEQEEKLSLSKLTGIENWTSYVDYLSEEGFENTQNIIDVNTLVRILIQDEMEVKC